ncbi:hypothetical protein N7474_001417 [Penicillium riverlandense]|uniref:uncharacterized protein n=1 Tax=Penicillium riverlandense TaxID=1903569 RepID=UPI0025495040|nr:uncharacterized protein N7474_001417 [Penicillium riverlandense]KAJ5833106.1 hypothetical protein N7474_001417 [Penicillium riverlandense]
MLSSNVYCPLCGVILLPNTDLADTRVRHWYTQIRGIYPTDAAAGDPVTTTGVGFVRYRKELHAPLDSDRSYFDVGIGPLETWKLCESSGRWCFGIHDSCWRLLLLRLRHFQDKAAIAKSVFYQLYCTPCRYASTFQFGHDYEGAGQTHEPFGRSAVNRMSQFYADPFEIPHNLEDFGHYKPYVPSSGDPTKERREKLERHVFTELSPELKFEIFSYLSFDELLNMRLFTFTSSDSSAWVGSSSGPGIAYGTIGIPDKLEQYRLLAGLDRYKIVSLGLGELTLNPRPGASPKLTSQDAMDSLRVQSYLWTSHLPGHEGLRISPLLPSMPSRAFEPLTNIDFGGPRGLFLKSLTRLTFYMASDSYPITGIEIFYSDRRSLLSGTKDGCELSFFLDGSNGERINQLGVLEDSWRDSVGLGGLQISTNYGRTTTFAPLRLRLNAALSQIPISPSGNTITGLVALEQTNQSRLIRVGIQSQQCDEQRMPPPDTLDCECYRTLEYQLRYDDKFTHFIDSSNPSNYQTYASLKDIRSIQASMGIQGRSRISNRLSGLKFEYYNHPSPSTVGQWMDEIDDGFEFSLDEAVQSLTIWLTPMGYSTERGLEVGQVAAIHIETTHSRSVTFRSPDFRSLPPQKLQQQYQSDRDETLTGISWILNASCDRVRAVISASTNEGRRAQILVPEHPPPFDQVRKLYFATQNDDGHRDTIVTAEAYFRDRAIIGLVFVYTSAAKASLGDFDTNARQTVRFPLDAQIVGFSVATKKRDLVEIEFEVERSEQPLYKKLRLSINYTVGYDRRDVWCKDEASAESHQRLLAGDRVYEPPSESKLVGIYVGCQEFFRVGALYESEVSQ